MNGDRILALISSKLWFQAFSTPSVHDMTTDPSSEYIFIVQVDSLTGVNSATGSTTVTQASTGNILKYDLLMPDRLLQTKITENDVNGQVCKLSQYSDTLILGAKSPQANQAVLQGL